MKKSLGIIALALAIGITIGCKEEKKSETIIVKKVEKKAPSNRPVAMQEYAQQTELKWGGADVVCEVSRKPDSLLAMVVNENGQKFVDNKINLSVKNAAGNSILSKTFTKSDFNSALDDTYRKRGILEGLVFDRVSGDTLYFAASVTLPQTDEYIPIVLKILKGGAISITRDTLMDTNAEE